VRVLKETDLGHAADARPRGDVVDPPAGAPRANEVTSEIALILVLHLAAALAVASTLAALGLG
jgi:hypothetical protein